MEEIIVKGNDTGLKVYVNGVPKIESIPNDELTPLIVSLEIAVSNHFENYQKRKKYTNKKRRWKISFTSSNFILTNELYCSIIINEL